MAVRDFRPIKQSDFTGAADILDQAGKSANRGAEAFRSVFGDIRKRNEAEQATQTRDNDQAIQAKLQGFSSLGEIQEAEKQGAFDINKLKQSFGNNYTADALTKGVTATKSKLLKEAVAQASGVGRKVAEEGLDINQGSKAMYDALVAQGVPADEAINE